MSRPALRAKQGTRQLLSRLGAEIDSIRASISVPVLAPRSSTHVLHDVGLQLEGAIAELAEVAEKRPELRGRLAHAQAGLAPVAQYLHLLADDV